MCSIVLLFFAGVFASFFVPVTVLQEPVTIPEAFTAPTCETVSLDQKMQDARAYPRGTFDSWDVFVDATNEFAIRISWTQDSNLAYLEYLDFGCGYTQEQIENYLDFDIILSSYESWEYTTACADGNLTLHEFDVNSDGRDYLMRYWVDPTDDTFLTILFLTFPPENAALLDSYAERLYPSLPSCDGS